MLHVFPILPCSGLQYTFAGVYLGLGSIAAFLAVFAVYSKVNAALQKRKVASQWRHVAEWHGVVPEIRDEQEINAPQSATPHKKPKVVDKITVTWR